MRFIDITQAFSDRLTGLGNKVARDRALVREFSRSFRQAQLASEEGVTLNKPLMICYIDLNNFKTINDTYGHEVGDEVLRFAASAIKSSVRATDGVFRPGGDEFTILLPECMAMGE